MQFNSQCVDCLLSKQLRQSGKISDPALRSHFLHEARLLLQERGGLDSAPYLVYKLDLLQERYGISPEIFPRHQYNQMILDLEEQIEAMICTASDPLERALVYARIGNYIDFGAMEKVNDDALLELIRKGGEERLDAQVYRDFVQDCEKARTLLLLCDNCGEIVFDKLLIHQLHRSFPNMKVYVMVRGKEVLNDATLDDAHECGMEDTAEVITNGSGISGTIYSCLPSDAKAVFDRSDVILSKGQGNYEGLSGTACNAYFLFLCKCDRFTDLFHVPKLTGMFVHDKSNS